VDSISNKSGAVFEYNIEDIFKDSIDAALKKEKLIADTIKKEPDLILSLNITEYRPGNAFKRWLLPGYGATVLSVDGELKDAKDRSVVATISHRQGVYAGGAYSIGAWKYIFSTVATDIAKDLKVKIEEGGVSEEGGAFVIKLPPHADVITASDHNPLPYTVFIDSFSDNRPQKNKIGIRTALKVPMGDVYFYHSVPVFLRESFATELLQKGFRIVNTGGDIRIRGEVEKFWIETPATLTYWDIVGNIQLKLTFASERLNEGSIEKVYLCNQTARTYIWPSEKLCSQVIENCINDLMNQIKSDKVWESAIRGQPKTKSKNNPMAITAAVSPKVIKPKAITPDNKTICEDNSIKIALFPMNIFSSELNIGKGKTTQNKLIRAISEYSSYDPKVDFALCYKHLPGYNDKANILRNISNIENADFWSRKSFFSQPEPDWKRVHTVGLNTDADWAIFIRANIAHSNPTVVDAYLYNFETKELIIKTQETERYSIAEVAIEMIKEVLAGHDSSASPKADN